MLPNPRRRVLGDRTIRCRTREILNPNNHLAASSCSGFVTFDHAISDLVVNIWSMRQALAPEKRVPTSHRWGHRKTHGILIPIGVPCFLWQICVTRGRPTARDLSGPRHSRRPSQPRIVTRSRSPQRQSVSTVQSNRTTETSGPSETLADTVVAPDAEMVPEMRPLSCSIAKPAGSPVASK